MACSYWLYIDATRQPPRLRVESTCPLTWADKVTEPRGSKIVLEHVIHELPVAVTPCRRLLPVPWPPYTTVDAVVVVDSTPRTDFYGLPMRRSTVVSTVKRTVLEGRGYIQLVDSALGQVIDEETLLVPPGRLHWFETAIPVINGIPSLDHVKICEQLHGGTIESWAACLDHAGLPSQYVEEMLSVASGDAGCGQRVYAAAALRAGTSPEEIVKPVSLALEAAAKSVRVRLTGAKRMALLLARSGERGRTMVEAVIGEGENIVEGMWDSYSVVCRDCWLPISGRRKG